MLPCNECLLNRGHCLLIVYEMVNMLFVSQLSLLLEDMSELNCKLAVLMQQLVRFCSVLCMIINIYCLCH